MSAQQTPRIVDWSPISTEDAAWFERYRLFHFEALSRVREAAQRWASILATITGIFGIATLVKGPTDLSKILDPSLGTVAQWLIILAITLAAYSTYLASAAQGLPTSAPRGDVEAFRQGYFKEIELSAERLDRSRRSAVVGLSFVAAAVLLTWYGTPRPYETVSTIIVDGAGTHCGYIVASSGNWLALRVRPAAPPSPPPGAPTPTLAPSPAGSSASPLPTPSRERIEVFLTAGLKVVTAESCPLEAASQ